MEGPTVRRFNRLVRDRAVDSTLSNLLELASAKLQLDSRLGVYQFEAEQEGYDDCAELFGALALGEREDLEQVLEGLRRLLISVAQTPPGPQAVCARTARSATAPTTATGSASWRES